jgi:3-oxoacyl-[acyl-carrier protein] reductase
MRFDGKNLIITGASLGIGKATVEQAVKLGARAAVVDIEIAAAEKLKKELSQYPVSIYKADVSKTKEVEQAMNRIIADFGQIHILINNAGIASKAPLEELSEEEWDRVINIDLKSVYNTCRIILPHMKKFKYGRIVNMSSAAGKLGGGFLSTCAYAAAKSGVMGLTKCLAREGGPFGITVNAVCPGSFDTRISAEMTGARLEAYLNNVCLRRRGTLEEVANVMLFLASDLASYVSGEITDIDGGQVMD